MATVKDVVCGMDVDPNAAPAREDYQGTTYYFCSPPCHDKFKAKPENYVAGQG